MQADDDGVEKLNSKDGRKIFPPQKLSVVGCQQKQK